LGVVAALLLGGGLTGVRVHALPAAVLDGCDGLVAAVGLHLGAHELAAVVAGSVSVSTSGHAVGIARQDHRGRQQRDGKGSEGQRGAVPTKSKKRIKAAEW
jgi:hypothetical protein